MTERISCINPTCRRTASAEKFAGEEIVCAKCWKLLPKSLTQRYRQIHQRWRKVSRKVERRIAKGGSFSPRLYGLLQRQRKANWNAIRGYLLSAPAPAGIETFLAEIGLD